MHLELANQVIVIRFDNGSSVSFRKNDFDQLVEHEYFVAGAPTSDDVFSTRISARCAVLERGYAVVLN